MGEPGVTIAISHILTVLKLQELVRTVKLIEILVLFDFLPSLPFPVDFFHVYF